MNDIKLMITLAGNQRLPHLEAAIFADCEFTYFYLDALLKGENWYSGTIETKKGCAWAAFWYAKYTIKGRWPEAEAVIASNTVYRGWYNKFLSELPI